MCGKVVIYGKSEVCNLLILFSYYINIFLMTNYEQLSRCYGNSVGFFFLDSNFCFIHPISTRANLSGVIEGLVSAFTL